MRWKPSLLIMPRLPSVMGLMYRTRRIKADRQIKPSRK